MDKKELLKAVGEMGFPLLPTEEHNANQVLAEVVVSKDPRLWEGFPVLLKNATAGRGFDPEKVAALLNEDGKRDLKCLVALALGVFKKYSLPVELVLGVTMQEVDAWRDLLGWPSDTSVGGVALSLERMLRLFGDYSSKQASENKNKLALEEEFSLEFALSQVLSPKQKELFLKKLNGKPLTKTEREYFSRTVRKKLSALANDELHRLAKLVR